MNPFRKLAQKAKSIFTGEKPADESTEANEKPQVTLDQIMQDIRPGRVTKAQKRGLRRRMRIGRNRARKVTNHPHAGHAKDSYGTAYRRDRNGVVTRITPKTCGGIEYRGRAMQKAIRRARRQQQSIRE